KDLGKLATREARIILGAAVIDDVMGLLILAILSGAIRATATGGALSMIDVGLIALKSVLFLIGSIVVGHFMVLRLLRGAGRLETRGVLLMLGISFCFVLMGLKVDLRLFTRLDILGFAALLTVAAIVGKQVCGLAVVERGINRLAVGLGMIPRGEVGLIFAGI